MTAIQLLWLIIGGTWAVIEVTLAVKTRTTLKPTITMEYRSERFIWVVVATALIVSLVLKQLHLAPIPIAAIYRQLIAIVMFIFGFSVRFSAVFALGTFFSTTVITQDGHELIENGPYQWVRHPAYSGLLCCFFSAGIAMGDFMALLSLICPVTYVVIQRISIEEAWLSKYFERTYSDYCLRTKRLFPGIY